MAIPLPSWLQISPNDYLAAAQAGAGVGLNIAKMRQASDFQNLESEDKRQERMSAAARLAAQLSNARDLKVMDIQQQQTEANQGLEMSKAALDFRKSGLDFDKAKEAFNQEQGRIKMRSDADVALQTGNLLKEVSDADTPEDRAKIVAKYSRSPVAAKIMLKSISEMDAQNSQTAKDKRAEEIAADVALETGNLLEELSSADTAQKRLAAAQRHPGTPLTDDVVRNALSQMSSEEKALAAQKITASKPVVESFTYRNVPEGEGMLKPGLNRFGSKGSVEWVSEKPKPQAAEPSAAAVERSQETIHRQHTALVQRLNASKSASDKVFLAKEIARLEAQYPFLVPMIAPVEDPTVGATSGAVIPMQPAQGGLTLPQTNSFTSGKYSVRIK